MICGYEVAHILQYHQYSEKLVVASVQFEALLTVAQHVVWSTVSDVLEGMQQPYGTTSQSTSGSAKQDALKKKLKTKPFISALESSSKDYTRRYPSLLYYYYYYYYFT